MKIELYNGVGLFPNSYLNIYFTDNEILTYRKVLVKILTDKKLNDKEKNFFIPLSKELGI